MVDKVRKSRGKLDALELRAEDEHEHLPSLTHHVCGEAGVCDTEERGYPTPGNRSPLEIVLDASDGFIPLWEPNRVLRWRFNENSMGYFRSPERAKDALRNLMTEALVAWGDAAPIRFREVADTWDFEIRMSPTSNCSPDGCTLARAFFPDAGRHDLLLFPTMFGQSRKEVVDTFIHEIGHIFGLRHFFAKVTETAWPSEIFGTHSKFSIMNYGELSELTEKDKTDLRTLYQSVWNGALDNINGTPIVLFKPYHYSAANAVGAFPRLAAARCC